MSFKIGVGVLIDGEPFNNIRLVQAGIAESIGDWTGYNQPPHITVKRPFLVENLGDVQRAVDVFDRVAGQYSGFDVFYDSIGSFGSEVVFLSVRQNNPLRRLHDNLLELMEVEFPGAKQPAEGSEDMIFHTSLALSLGNQRFAAAKASADDLSDGLLLLHVPIRQIGLFISTDGKHWVVMRAKELSGTNG